MLKQLLIASLLSSSLALMGCQSNMATSSANITTNNLTLLQSTTWIATKIGNDPIQYAQNSAPRASLKFDATTHRVTGTDGCNRLMGNYTVEKDRIQFEQMATTRMACLNNNHLDQKFNQALAKVTHYQVFGNTLKLLDRHGNPLLEFENIIQPR
ncbi:MULTISPECIES: META domain-containing protein [unclassified Acinetobacter]|uniref:META domain-containing protein n=1 Tax=unclassified Acinetobacter TaxID=196816 RepID=UPI002934C5BB|nr:MULTISPECIES: META domain-containing protein [unclassified Acinetobacter]WOE31198.1 META domain-containing protein [Acinetobacter sp. SAAs470]WOE39394.1 META domain-containing protein [Acinetobacter sp. SAAs474]